MAYYNNKKILSVVHGSGGGEQPQLFAPTISLNVDVLTCDNSANGDFSTTLKLYLNNQTYLTDLVNGQINLNNYFQNEGTYSLSVKATASLFQESNFSNVVTYRKTITPRASASVRGLGSEDPDDIIFEVDEEFPTTFEEVTIGDDVFIKFPTFYRRVDNVVDGQITAFTISTLKIDNDFQPYPCFIDYVNGGTLPYVLIGKYLNSNGDNIANSVNATPSAISINDNIISMARRRGDYFQSYDWQFHKLFLDLKMVIEQDIRFDLTCDTCLGLAHMSYYNQNSSYILVVGYGASADHSTWVVEYDPRNYEMNINQVATKTSLSYRILDGSTSGVVKSLGYDNDNPFANFATETIERTSANQTKYYCSFEAKAISHVGLSMYGSHGNSLFGTATQAITGYKYGRLCYRPIQINS